MSNYTEVDFKYLNSKYADNRLFDSEGKKYRIHIHFFDNYFEPYHSANVTFDHTIEDDRSVVRDRYQAQLDAVKAK